MSADRLRSLGRAALIASSVASCTNGSVFETFETTNVPTPETIDLDNLNQQLISEATGGEKVLLRGALVGYTGRASMPIVGDFYYTALTDSQGEVYALVENSDCIFENLRDSNSLGEEVVSGIWRPKARFDMQFEVAWSKSVTNPIPWLTLESFWDKEELVLCPKESRFGGIGSLPEQIAQLLGREIRDVLEGLREGFRR